MSALRVAGNGAMSRADPPRRPRFPPSFLPFGGGRIDSDGYLLVGRGDRESARLEWELRDRVSSPAAGKSADLNLWTRIGGLDAPANNPPCPPDRRPIFRRRNPGYASAVALPGRRPAAG